MTRKRMEAEKRNAFARGRESLVLDVFKAGFMLVYAWLLVGWVFGE